MKYIIMCGGKYRGWETPRQLTKINGESIVERTIRLLREDGVENIAISSNHEAFEHFGVPVLHHENPYDTDDYTEFSGNWVDGFYPITEPVCYIFGDVVFSPKAIRTIVETETDDIEFFASAPPFADKYFKPYAEPFALKVANQYRLKRSIEILRDLDKRGMFRRRPIMWELWQVIKGTELNHIDYTNYTVINDYTCDVDCEWDARQFTQILKEG